MDKWINKKVKEICQIGRGRVISQEEIHSKPGVYPVYSSQSMNKGEMGRIDSYDFDGEYVTWTTDGAYAGTVFHRTGKFNCTNVCGTLKAKVDHELDLLFLSYLLSTESKKHVSYVGNPKLMNGVMGEISLNLPEDKPEQTRIAQILSKADAAIAQTEALIAKYQRIKTGLMQDLLTSGIDEHGKIRNEETHRFKTEKGLRLPEEWEVVELESVCHKIADRDHTTPIYVADGVFIVSPKDFNDLHEIEFTKCLRITLEAHLINRRKTNIEVDDLIFTRIGAGLGKICKVTSEMPEFSILHSACMLKPNQEKILSDFLLYYIKSEFAQKQIVDGIQSIGVPDLGMDKIRTFLVKKPKTIDEQVKILKPLLKLDNLIRKETAELSKQKSLKTGLMQDLLSGRVRVNAI